MERCIKIHKIINRTRAEGPGCRLALWVQGCSLHCPGCFEKAAWDVDGGYYVKISEIIDLLRDDRVEGITVLGGEPFEQADKLEDILKATKNFKKNSIVFSGYTYEELKKINSDDVKMALYSVDLLIDGRFEQKLHETARPLIGSENQRFIALSQVGIELLERLNFLKNKVEIRINKEGIIMVNGMWKAGSKKQ